MREAIIEDPLLANDGFDLRIAFFISDLSSISDNERWT